MARTTKGRIFRRGKNNYYYLQYYVNGKQFVVVLLDERGQNISTLREAKKAADKILSPLLVREEATRIEKVSEALATAEQKAEAAELEAANNKAVIANGWELFYSCPKRPRSCRKYAIAEIPRTSTAAIYRAYYQTFAAWMQEHHTDTRLLAEVTEAQAIEFVERIKADKASGTVNKYLQFLKCFYETIITAGKVGCKNPFAEIEREEHTYNSRKALTVEQIANLLDNAEGELKTLFALGYFTGLRRGDCCTLLWSEVDLIRGIIERIPRKIAGRVKDPAQAIVKIGIAPLLADLLADIPAADRRGYVLPEMARLYTSGKDYTVTSRITAHFHSCGIETRLPGTGYKSRYEGKKKVYEPSKRAVVQYGFHSLRYSYISHNAERGTPQAIIQRNAGHSNPAMTEHYTRISDTIARQYASKLQLPGTEQPDNAADAERAELKALADSLDIETVRRLLAEIR